MNEQTRTKSMGTDFTQGPIMPMLLKFFLPFLLANLLNSIYNLVDTIIVGQFLGSIGIVAVSSGGKTLNMLTSVGTGFSGGGQILVSQLAGAKQKEEYNSSIGTLFSSTLILSVSLAVLTLLLSNQIIAWLNTPAEAVAEALIYLRITAVGLPLMYGYNAVSSVLRGMGDSKSPLMFIAIAAVFNLIGDVVFVVCFGMGAAGTAIATVMGQGLSLAFSVALLYRKKERFGFDFRLRSFSINKHKLRVILKVGLPMALQSLFISGTQLVMMGFVNLFGLVESAAYSIGDKVYHLANIFSMAIRQASGSMAGQNFGADRFDRVKIIVRDSLIVNLTAATLLSTVSLLFPKAIFSLFTSDPAVIAFGPTFMRICCLIFFLSAIMAGYASVVTATGAAMLSLIAGILDGMILRVCLSFLFAYALEMGVTGFFLADALARCAPLCINAVFYHSGAWKRRKKLLNK